jgi:hypothetical protein
MDDQPMTARDRYVNTLLFKGTDRAPLVPGYGRESTHNRWYQEGLPKGTRNIAEYAYREAGGTLDWPEAGEDFYIDTKMIPTFEEKVIEKRTHTQIVQDWKGNICEIGLDFSVAHLREPIDFCTRSWIRCPVETRRDWNEMQKRYDSDYPARFPDDARKTGKRLADRKHPIVINISGPFWQLREWLGFERLCLLFHDDPGWIKEMIAFWEDFVIRLLCKLFTYLVPEHVHFSEDMAYKAHPMISPAMTREFLLPSWSRWSGTCHDAGVHVVGIDSDGDVSTLIPLMIDAGFDYVDPMEVAAGNDLPAYRKNYGRKVAFGGGIDKREIAKGGEHIVRELDRLKPVIGSGGYIPSCDHAIPVDVGWAEFVHYVRTLAKATGWL